MTKKLGVYMCKGCGLGDALDMEKLDKKVPPKVKFRFSHDILCSSEAVDLIKKDIEGRGEHGGYLCLLPQGASGCL